MFQQILIAFSLLIRILLAIAEELNMERERERERESERAEKLGTRALFTAAQCHTCIYTYTSHHRI
jgi:hypothetical protein